ncbi:hypothetical protein FNJ84_07370 [Paracoccus sp. M683]|uniref:hypothetical protein n=1 Tax=Paracoccus sp. M683 TaxID=2594268 RepID=UPI00117C2849|nr:hypothetical protein [Paracoccus sp. M683]TRW97330.1 hypothetical protein FNJ84_07370 [Paracoccus sp. M683]
MTELDALINQTGQAGIAPALVSLLIAMLALNLAVFIGRRVPNVLIAYPLAMISGLLITALAPLVSSFLLLAA